MDNRGNDHVARLNVAFMGMLDVYGLDLPQSEAERAAAAETIMTCRTEFAKLLSEAVIDAYRSGEMDLKQVLDVIGDFSRSSW